MPTRALRMAETTGRPVGAAEWLRELEARTGRSLAPRRRGPNYGDSLLNAPNPAAGHVTSTGSASRGQGLNRGRG